MSISVEDRFWGKVDIRGPDDCWEWRSTKDQKGYAKFWCNGGLVKSSRMAWSLANNKPFPSDMLACHSCDNPGCCNPAHIWPGTNSDNIRDSINKGRMTFDHLAPYRGSLPKTHCHRGHPYSPENTLIYGRNRRRECRICWEARKAIANIKLREKRRQQRAEKRAQV